MTDAALEELIEEVRQAIATLARVEKALGRSKRLSAEPQRVSETLTLAEAAAAFGRHEKTIRKWCRLYGIGELREGKWFVRRDLVKRFTRPSM